MQLDFVNRSRLITICALQSVVRKYCNTIIASSKMISCLDQYMFINATYIVFKYHMHILDRYILDNEGG